MVRLAAQRAGIDLVPYPYSSPLWGVARLLETRRVATVLDVGANDGGYGSGIRRHGYRGRIISFEPLQQVFEKLQVKARNDEGWQVVRSAVGDCHSLVTINVAGNEGASSSVLPMLDRHMKAAPQASYVGTEEVQQVSLDEVARDMNLEAAGPLYLKADVQGYERAVLQGAAGLLESGQIIGMQLELSFVPLYEGAMTWEEGLERGRDLGMQLMGLERGFIDGTTGQALQADAVFYRP